MREESDENYQNFAEVVYGRLFVSANIAEKIVIYIFNSTQLKSTIRKPGYWLHAPSGWSDVYGRSDD